MWRKIDGFFSRDRRLPWVAAFSLLALTGWADYATGIEYGFGLFYLIPVALISWYAAEVPGLVMSVLAAATWALADYLPRLLLGRGPARLHITLWNAVIGLGIYAAFALTLSKLKRTLEREREVLRLKSRLLSAVSHEFNNSLTSMGMAILLLRQSGEDPEERQRIYPVLERIHLLLKTTVRNFLDQARMESGRFRLDIKQINLRVVIKGTMELMLPLVEQKHIDLRFEFPEAPLPMTADPDAIALVMSNLISNAVKYTPNQGRVTVRIAPLEEGREAEVSVEDTGIGIAPKDQEAIFTGFYRTDEGRKQAKGFGLGLLVSREIVEAHGSSLKISSEPGRGSRFYFRLPICQPDCPNRDLGLCHRCRERNPRAEDELFDSVK